MEKTYGYFGPKGTNSEEALFAYLGKEIRAQEFANIEQVFEAVENQRIDFGVVPIENSIEGPINLTLDLLVQSQKVKIVGEVIIPIRHHLLVTAGTDIQNIHLVLSHPQALAQCRQKLNALLPEIETAAVKSTAEAAKLTAQGNSDVAAIASQRAAIEYGLEACVTNIQDSEENMTRFVVLSALEDSIKAEKTSIVVCITDRSGGLYEILREFALADINLVKIESRPTKKGLGDYLFFIDFIGSIDDAAVAKSLKAIEKMAVLFKVLGTYPAWEKESDSSRNRPKFKRNFSLEELREEVDIIDFQIVELMAKRTKFVKQIGAHKVVREIVKDPSRERAVLRRVKDLARKKGASPELIESMYRVIFDFFVELQEKMTEKKPST